MIFTSPPYADLEVYDGPVDVALDALTEDPPEGAG
jgi:hypothetical protein